MKKSKFSPEVRERSVRMVFEQRAEYESQWAAIESIASKIGCSAQTLSNWIRQHDTDNGQRPGTTTAEAQRIKELERENRELKKANEIPKLASAFFAQAELDRRFKSWEPSSTAIARPSESSRSAGCCNSLHQVIGVIKPSSAILARSTPGAPGKAS